MGVAESLATRSIVMQVGILVHARERVLIALVSNAAKAEVPSYRFADKTLIRKICTCLG